MRMTILRLAMRKNHIENRSRGKDIPLRTVLLQRALWRNLVVPPPPRPTPGTDVDAGASVEPFTTCGVFHSTTTVRLHS